MAFLPLTPTFFVGHWQVLQIYPASLNCVRLTRMCRDLARRKTLSPMISSPLASGGFSSSSMKDESAVFLFFFLRFLFFATVYLPCLSCSRFDQSSLCARAVRTWDTHVTGRACGIPLAVRIQLRTELPAIKGKKISGDPKLVARVGAAAEGVRIVLNP